MKKFLLLLHDDVEKMSQLSPKDFERLTASHFAWAEKLAEAGHLISGEGLDEKRITITGSDSIVKDGSFIEAKEMIGGFYFLQADSLETIIEIAKECPCHHWGGTTEIRPIMDYEA